MGGPWHRSRTTLSVPMAKLPRIARPRRRSRAVEVAPRSEPRLTELSANGLTWINLSVPDAAASEELAERFEWHPLDIEDVLSKRQRPKIDEYPDYLFVVLHFPVYDKAVQRLNAAELDVFLGHGYLVTLPNVELLPVTRLFQRCVDDEDAARGPLLEGLGLPAVPRARRPLRLLLPHPRQDRPQARHGRGRDVRGARGGGRARPLQRQAGDHLVPEDHQARAPTLRALERRTERFLPEELDVYFDDIVDSAERIWDLLDNYKEVVEGLESTNESVISHRHNEVLRVLTVFTVLLLPLTLIASVFGMNVVFPGEGTHEAFWVILGLMVAAIAGLAAFFRWKRWL